MYVFKKMDATLFVIFFILMKSLHAEKVLIPTSENDQLVLKDKDDVDNLQNDQGSNKGNDQHVLKNDEDKLQNDQGLNKGTDLQQSIHHYFYGLKEILKQLGNETTLLATLHETKGLTQAIKRYVDGLTGKLDKMEPEVLKLATLNAGDQQLKDQVAKLEEKVNHQGIEILTLNAKSAAMVGSIHSESGQAWLGWSHGKTGVLIDKNISFTKIYTSPPNVILSMDTIDVGNGKPIRVHLRAHDVTKTGFRLTMMTWSKTVWYQARVTWLAVTDTPLTDI